MQPEHGTIRKERKVSIDPVILLTIYIITVFLRGEKYIIFRNSRM